MKKIKRRAIFHFSIYFFFFSKSAQVIKTRTFDVRVFPFLNRMGVIFWNKRNRRVCRVYRSRCWWMTIISPCLQDGSCVQPTSLVAEREDKRVISLDHQFYRQEQLNGGSLHKKKKRREREKSNLYQQFNVKQYPTRSTRGYFENRGRSPVYSRQRRKFPKQLYGAFPTV